MKSSQETQPERQPPKGDNLKRGLEAIDRLEKNSRNNSDPFLFNRMRTHFKAGILDVGDIPGGSNK